MQICNEELPFYCAFLVARMDKVTRNIEKTLIHFYRDKPFACRLNDEDTDLEDIIQMKSFERMDKIGGAKVQMTDTVSTS